MRKLWIPIFVIVTLLFSCEKKCGSANSKCLDSINSDSTTCLAYWESWFYNQSTGTCEFKGYSGCSPIGFETKTECMQCACH